MAPLNVTGIPEGCARFTPGAIINVRYMTTGVVGTASELLVYGTAVKLTT